MAFAAINPDLSYWKKQAKPLYPDLVWNIPERKTGRVTIIGGNLQGFSAIIRISEFMNQNFPFSTLTTILPETLRNKLPKLPGVKFALSTSNGSFAKSALLQTVFDSSDAVLLAGDLSRNSETAIALNDVIHSKTKIPLVLARDSVDLLAPEGTSWLPRPQTFIVASMLQLQKLFRSVYYPRMILLSQPLLQVLETLHKFTLTYPVTILTFHQGNIIVAYDGQVSTTHLTDTEYSPIGLWSGQLAARTLALNLYNPNKPFEATTAAILYKDTST